MLLTPEKSIARELGQQRPLRVIGVGTNVTWGEDVSDSDIHPQYDRQVPLFGVAGQKILRSIRVGLVGLGGTGSIVLQALAHLGVQDFLLLDPDIIEETNLNRLVGATPKDLGLPKVPVAKAWTQRINSDVRIEARQDTVLKAAVARSLADTDFVFCCTDSHGSRAVFEPIGLSVSCASGRYGRCHRSTGQTHYAYCRKNPTACPRRSVHGLRQST